MSTKTVIIIGGPTAVGKTSVAIAVAQQLGTEIISADSRQCYTELNIGVARPSIAELAAVPHHFIASHSIQEKVTAATFEQYALDKAAHLFQKHNTVVMVGGTGLYIRAFCNGFDPIPDVPEPVQQQVRTAYANHGLPWLQSEVARFDPLFFTEGEIQNPQRMMRALEVFLATGKSILEFRKGASVERPFRIIKVALELPREQLYANVNRRVDDMIEQGLEAEVRSLQQFSHLNALQTVGYREMFDYFNGFLSLAQAVDAIKLNTRHYAKRQLTWFRKDEAYRWFTPAQIPELLAYLQQQLAGS